VMTRGRAVQMGTASQLFEEPQHTFVGNFIGSPGMNFLPAQWAGDGIAVAGHTLRGELSASLAQAGEFTLGVRPEYVQLAQPGEPQALPAKVEKAQDIGTYWLLTATSGDAVIRARLSPDATAPQAGEDVWLKVLGSHTCFYDKNQEIIR